MTDSLWFQENLMEVRDAGDGDIRAITEIYNDFARQKLDSDLERRRRIDRAGQSTGMAV